MPFLSAEETKTRTIIDGVHNAPELDIDPDFWRETVPAAFRMENTLGAIRANDSPEETELDPDFDPIPHVPPTHVEFADRYALANSTRDIRQIEEQIDQEMKNRQTLSDAGAMGFLATAGAGAIDPINLIPVGGVLYKTFRTGGSILRNAAVTGMAGGISMSAQEALLHQQQQTRTLGESATNVSAAIFLTSILGGGATALKNSMGRSRVRDVQDGMERDMDLDSANQGGGSVGAAAATDLPAELLAKIEAKVQAKIDAGKIDPADAGSELALEIQAGKLKFEGINKNLAMQGLMKVVGRQDPILRGLGSQSLTMKRFTQQMAEIPLELQKNQFGEATPVSVQAKVRGHQAGLYRSLGGMDDLYIQYTKGRNKRFGDIARAGIGNLVNRSKDGRKLTYKEFRNEIGRAMRRGDAHEIPEVAKAAQMFRREVYDPLKNSAIELKLLADDVDPETALTYLNRKYNTEKLADPAERSKFKERTTEWMMRRQEGSAERAARFDDEVARLEAAKKAEIDATKIKGLEDEIQLLKKQQVRDEIDISRDLLDFEDIAEQLVGRIEGTPAGRLAYDVTIPQSRRGKAATGVGAPLKARAFKIEDELIEEWLENDIEYLSKTYMRTMAPDVELARAFGNDFIDFEAKGVTDSSVELHGILDDIRRDWVKWREANPGKGDAWKKGMDSDFKDVLAMRDKIRGTYGLPDDPKNWGFRVGRAIRQLNYTRLLGGMTLSAIPDTARPVMVNGFKRVFNDALVPFITNFKQLKLSAKEIRDMGLASDMLMNSRAQQLADVADDFGRYTAIERGIGALSDTFGTVSAMAPWNTFFKQLAGVVSMQRINRAIQADIKGSISKKELTFLRAGGVGEAMGKRIANQLDAHGATERGVLLPGWLNWSDKGAAETFQAALGREIERTIVTPGLDIPLVASGGSGEVARHIFQFKSFALASTQRMLLSGMQQKDVAALNGLWFSVAMGMSVYALKELDAGRELSDDPEKWLVEGIDRSGVTAWLFEPNNILEKVSRGNLGVSAMIGAPPLSRYQSRNAAGALLGPSFGTLTSGLKVAGSAAAATFGEDEWRESDTHALRRLLPYQNLVGFRQLVDKAEEGVNSTLGIR